MAGLTASLLAEGRARIGFPVLALFLSGALFLGDGLYIAAKAGLAQWLLDRAWNSTVGTGEIHKPWGWADTWPVARIEFPVQEKNAIILHGVSGQALAFGPGLMPGLEKPGQPGVSMISAHKDTHFRFLKEVEKGEGFFLQTLAGEKLVYRVTGFSIVDGAKPITISETDASLLVLSTCYPFDALSYESPLRYLVIAELVN